MSVTCNIYFVSNIEWDSTYNNVLQFNDIESQKTYFSGRVNSLYPLPLNPPIKGGSINVNYELETVNTFNYFYFTSNKSGRAYYCFIDRSEYVAETTTRLHYTIDVMQTYMFDYDLKESFIARQHCTRWVRNGLPLYNLHPENLNIGTEYDTALEYRDTSSEFSYLGNTYRVMWYYISAKAHLCTNNSLGMTKGVSRGVYTYVTCEISPVTINDSLRVITNNSGGIWFNDTRLNIRHQSQDISNYTDNPALVSVTCSLYPPFDVVYNPKTNETNGYPYLDIDVTYTVLRGISYQMATSTISPNYTNRFYWIVSEYTPKTRLLFELDNLFANPIKPTSYTADKAYQSETKLYTYPYMFYRLKSSGDVIDFRNENFRAVKKISYIKSMGLTNNDILIPHYYNSNDVELDDDNVRNCNMSNDINLRTDAWQAYSMSHKASLKSGLLVNTMASMGKTAIGGVVGGVVGGGVGAVGGVVGGLISAGANIANEMLNREDIKNTPDDVRQVANSADGIAIRPAGLEIRAKQMRIKSSFYMAVFNYFFKYGYAYSNFELPNIKSRYYFNYIKTTAVNINPRSISNDTCLKIKSIYNSGVTFWHYRDAKTFRGMYDYTRENIEMELL